MTVVSMLMLGWLAASSRRRSLPGLGADLLLLATPPRPWASARPDCEARCPVGAERLRPDGRALYRPPQGSDLIKRECGVARAQPRRQASGSGNHSFAPRPGYSRPSRWARVSPLSLETPLQELH